MSPQLLAKQDYSYKTDIWSLGVIFYEIIFNQMPWSASSCDELYAKIVNQGINYSKKNIPLSNDAIKFLNMVRARSSS